MQGWRAEGQSACQRRIAVFGPTPTKLARIRHLHHAKKSWNTFRAEHDF
jgi:hypothetical protein